MMTNSLSIFMALLAFRIVTASAADAPDVQANTRFEDCLAAAQRASLPEAIASACPASSANHIESSGAARPGISFELISAALGLQGRASCNEPARDAAPEIAALCALSSKEHLMLSGAPGRRGGSYGALQISRKGVRDYVAHVLRAAQVGGFRRLAENAQHALSVSEPTQTESLRHVLHQADFLAKAFEQGAKQERYMPIANGAMSNVSAIDFPARTFELMQRAGRLESSDESVSGTAWALLRHAVDSAAPETTSLSSASIIADSWAADAAHEFARKVAALLQSSEVAPAELAVVQAYVGQIMHGVTQRAGMCALACSEERGRSHFVLPLPLSADLSVPITIRP